MLHEYIRRLSMIRALFLDEILKKCEDPKVQWDEETNPVIYDGDELKGVVRLKVEDKDGGLLFTYTLDKETPFDLMEEPDPEDMRFDQ